MSKRSAIKRSEQNDQQRHRDKGGASVVQESRKKERKKDCESRPLEHPPLTVSCAVQEGAMRSGWREMRTEHEGGTTKGNARAIPLAD